MVKVSIICTAYNHEKYIRDALESFLAQKTNFPIEILIHDDASTDATPGIIREYEQRFPQLFQVIYQKENQYSKGVRITEKIILPRAKGKYFALCEGDDFWTDPQKLQKQFNYMERNPDCTLCVHNAYKIFRNNPDKIVGEFSPCKVSGSLSPEDVIVGGGSLFATNSIFAPTALFRSSPDYFNIRSNDYVWEMYLASCGRTYCFCEYMSVYRSGVENSWCDRMNRASIETKIAHIESYVKVRQAFDNETNHKFHVLIQKLIVGSRVAILHFAKNLHEMRRDPFKRHWDDLPMYNKMHLILEKQFPWLLNVLKIVKHRIPFSRMNRTS